MFYIFTFGDWSGIVPSSTLVEETSEFFPQRIEDVAKMSSLNIINSLKNNDTEIKVENDENLSENLSKFYLKKI